jgi:hypothetical protein
MAECVQGEPSRAQSDAFAEHGQSVNVGLFVRNAFSGLNTTSFLMEFQK